MIKQFPFLPYTSIRSTRILGVDQQQFKSQIWPPHLFLLIKLNRTQPNAIIYVLLTQAFSLKRQSEVVMTETICLSKPKIFPFLCLQKKKLDGPCIKHLHMCYLHNKKAIYCYIIFVNMQMILKQLEKKLRLIYY